MSSAFPAVGMAHFIESNMTYIALPMGVYVELIITRNILFCFSIFPLLISSGTRTAFPMGVAPEATAKDLCLVVGSTPYAAIFSFFPEIFKSIGCANSAPDGSSPRGYEQIFVFDHRLTPFLFCLS